MTNEEKALEILKMINYPLLREQKTTLFNMFDDFKLKQNHIDALNGIIQILNSIQDFAVDEMGMDEDKVFDLDVEDKEDDVPCWERTKLVHLCGNCASDNIQFRAWVNPNNEEEIEYILDDGDLKEDHYCLDCNKNMIPFTDEMNVQKKIIGYQVIHVLDKMPTSTEFHPEIKHPYQVFSLPQAKKMIKDSEQWQLFTIWSGDFIKPEMMFKGELR